MRQKTVTSLSKATAMLVSIVHLGTGTQAADLKLIGTHPTSRLTGFPAIHTLKAFEDRIYLGYGNWDVFPAVVVASYQPSAHAFHIEFSVSSDDLGTFHEIGGVLYVPSTDPGFYEDSRDYSYRARGVWRDRSPAGLLHAFDMGTLTGSDLWLVGSKRITETPAYNAAVFRSSDDGRSWQDLTIQSALPEGRYYWGFALRGRFYVRDTYYEGTNGTRTAAAPYVYVNKATPIGEGAAEFIVGLSGSVPGGDGLAHPLVTYNTQTWRTLRNNVYDFAVNGSNVFTLESRSIWMGSSVTHTQAVWQRLSFTNVPSNARAIEVFDGAVYLGDTQGRLWAGRLDGGSVNTNSPAVVNELDDDFGKGLSFDGAVMAVGAPDYSGAAPMCGQVSIWEQQADGEAGAVWRRTSVIDPPVASFSGWFGKDVMLKDGVLAVVEGGRDLSRTNRGGSARVHLYERSGESWILRTNLNHPFAQSVAIDSGWLAVGAGSALAVPATRLHLYSFATGPSGLEVRLRTNIVVRAPGNFWKPAAHVALEGDLCVVGSTGDISFDGAPGQISIYQRDAADVWRLQQVLHSPAPPPTDQVFTGRWMYDLGGGVWQANGQQTPLISPMTSRLNSPAVTVSQTSVVQFSFSHRWSFEPGWDGGQVRVSINGGPYSAIPRTAFTQNAYNGTVRADSTSELRGQSAFVNQSTGHATGSRVTSTCSLGSINAGETVSIQFLYAGDNASRGSIPNWEIDNVTLSETGGPVLKSEDFSSSDGGYAVQTDTPVAPDRFGFALALRNGWLAVGAPRDDISALQAGAVHLYERTNSPAGIASFVFRQSILSPLNQPEAIFGASVALKDSALLVGSPGAEVNGQRHHGAVFLFGRDQSSWRNLGEVPPPSGSEGEFGTRVAFAENWLAASSRFSQNSSNLAERIALRALSPPGGQLTRARHLSSGDFELSVIGEVGRTYELQAATDLLARNWVNLFPFTLVTSATNLVDTAAAKGPQRYYRLMSGTDIPSQ